LDEAVRCKNYFYNRRWRSYFNAKAVSRAVEALEGNIEVDWNSAGAEKTDPEPARLAPSISSNAGQRRKHKSALWTEDDDAVAKRLYPDYQAICKALGRTYSSIRHFCQRLGLAPKRHVWTAPEIARLRRMFPTATKDELRTAFHGFSFHHIALTATRHGFRRARRPFKPTGFDVIDQIRERSFQLGYSMPYLDEISCTKGYFTQQQWIAGKRVNYKAVAKAIKALDGEVSAEWND
jgi:hypothetical protein